jgi:hypothetical protein
VTSIDSLCVGCYFDLHIFFVQSYLLNISPCSISSCVLVLTSLDAFWFEGNFLLSIRPASGSASDSGESGKEEETPSAYDWSDDVKGAKAVRVSNLFEKFQHDFKRKIGGRNSDVAFGTG